MAAGKTALPSQYCATTGACPLRFVMVRHQGHAALAPAPARVYSRGHAGPRPGPPCGHARGAPRDALRLRCRPAAAAGGGAGGYRHRGPALAALGRPRQPRHPQPLPRLGPRPLLADAVDRGHDRRPRPAVLLALQDGAGGLPALPRGLPDHLEHHQPDRQRRLHQPDQRRGHHPPDAAALFRPCHALRPPQRHHRRAQPAHHPAGLPRHRRLAGLGGAAGHPRAGAARPQCLRPGAASSACSAPASATSRRSSAA